MGLLGGWLGTDGMDDEERRRMLARMFVAGAQPAQSRGQALMQMMGGGLLGIDEAKAAKQQRERQAIELQTAQLGLQGAQRQATAQQGMLDAYKGATRPEAPMTGMIGSLDQQDMPRPGPGVFDPTAFIAAAAPHALVTGGPQGLAQLQQMYAKTDPFAEQRKKVDLKDFTPESVRAYLATGTGPGQLPDLAQLVPRDKIVADDNGAVRTYRTEYSLNPLARVGRDVDPNTLFTGTITQRGQNMADARAREAHDQADRHFRATQNKPGFHMIGENPFMVSPSGTATPVRDPGTGQPIAGDKKLTESEAKNAMYLAQMTAASEALRQIEKPGGYNPNSTLDQYQVNRVNSGGFTGTVSNVFARAPAQQAAQAQTQWAEAFLRVKTGAAATEGEVQRNVRTFFPQVGDSAAVIEQKNAMRAEAERDMLMGVGPAKKQLEPRTQPSTHHTPKGPELQDVTNERERAEEELRRRGG